MSRKNTDKRMALKIKGDKLVLLLAIVAITIIFTILNKNYFTITNFVNILLATSLVGLIAIGHTYLIIAGLNDLSPGSLAAFAGVFAALLSSKGVPFFLVLIMTMIACGLVGIFNAFMVNRIHLDPFIATLVTQSIMRGVAYIISGGIAIAVTEVTFIAMGKTRLIGLPLPIWILIIAFIIFGYILSKTTFGRSIYAIGGNRDAARLAGLNPSKIVVISYIMMGVLCGLGGTVLAARMNSGQPSACVNLEFDAITAVILGGVSFLGGVGDMTGTVLGVILIQAFNTGLTMVNVPSFWQYIAKGMLLLIALTIDYIRKVNREKKLLEDSMKNM